MLILSVVTGKLTKPWKPEIIIIVWNEWNEKAIRYVKYYTKLQSSMITSLWFNVGCWHVLIIFKIAPNTINIPELFQAFMVL